MATKQLSGFEKGQIMTYSVRDCCLAILQRKWITIIHELTFPPPKKMIRKPEIIIKKKVVAAKEKNAVFEDTKMF